MIAPRSDKLHGITAASIERYLLLKGWARDYNFTVYFDRMEFRIISSLSQDGKLPLDYATDCIEGLKELILYSACAEQNAQPICFRATNAAKEYLESFKLVQTEVGSFVINIDIQVVDDRAEMIGQNK